ncbi:MAG: DUF11 domain-containing protein [Ardenticatenaceae bacterium]|nr:DUF11 domain-containing protein [Anaerolineales bacterium]MCB8941298.1 DUF11 domain-containing protein [Ardenticatenaceae bacterium]MCB8972653.1 DUF11 domain-containing protein [Ardenticatenaceae bacterium]
MLQKFRVSIVMVCLFMVLAVSLAMVQVMMAGVTAADLSDSSLSVDKSSTVAGGSVQYTAVISNSGDTAVNGVVFTDTLPAEVTYQANSFASNETNATTIGFGDSGNVITWTGNVESLGSVSLRYAATVTDTAMVNDVIENTINISGTGVLITRAASITIVDSFAQIMPVIGKSVPAPTLDPVQGPTASGNSWTLTWNEPVTNVTSYQIQEANTPDFADPVVFNVGNAMTYDFTYALSTENIYCYRVRAFVGTQASGWSNVECTVGNYLDDMSNPNSGWAIRQQDTDDTENSSYYENGEFVVKIGGRWDYALASPLAQAPKPPYAIETSIKFDPTVDNLHGYGIVFGGNWNGQPCPSASLENCFTHYYRFLVVWYGPQNSFRVQLKRIDYNDDLDNIGRGVSLVDFRDISVGDSKGYNVWRVEVDPDGSIRVYLNGQKVASAVDGSYVNNSPYFGIMASSDEYLGAEPHVDWYRVIKR